MKTTPFPHLASDQNERHAQRLAQNSTGAGRLRGIVRCNYVLAIIFLFGIPSAHTEWARETVEQHCDVGQAVLPWTQVPVFFRGSVDNGQGFCVRETTNQPSCGVCRSQPPQFTER